jgi:kumamolisin
MAKKRFAYRGAWGASCIAGLLAAATTANAQSADAVAAPAQRPQIVIPLSGLEEPGDVGKRVHTNVELFVPAGGLPTSVNPEVGPPASGYLFETPASVACVYNLVTPASGCNPNVVTANATGGSRAIAIVDAYDYLTATSDLAAFIKQFGLAPANFTVIYGTGSPSAGCKSGSKPPSAAGTGWDVEEALDIEWAHAMAPSAKLYLVEAASNSNANLYNAVQVAAKCVQASGGGQVSMSFGGSEFSGETSLDPIFSGTNVVYFAAAGDYFWNGNSLSPGVLYPAASPNVIGVGGTALSRNQRTGGYQSQAVWSNEDLYYYNLGTSPGPDSVPTLGTGGGPSAYEARPSYQNGITTIVGSVRGTPDLGGIADPASGVWLYDTTSGGGWMSVGGTSLATPVTAAIFNNLGLFYLSTKAALSAIYGNTGSVRTSHVTPIVNGDCGPPGHVTSGGYAGGYGQPYDPAYIYDTTGIAWGWCNGWGSMHK